MTKEIKKNDTLFDGNDVLFKYYLKKCKVYFEYGIGKSTLWVLKNTKANIISIDTDKKWIDTIPTNNYETRLKLIWVNLGELTDWGRPNSYKYKTKFGDYINGVWNYKKKADVTLIDGRFRVACFLSSLLNSKINAIIIFDDYLNRPWYHVVEEIVPIYKQYGRQGIFKVPKHFDKELTKELLNKFLYVFD